MAVAVSVLLTTFWWLETPQSVSGPQAHCPSCPLGTLEIQWPKGLARREARNSGGSTPSSGTTPEVPSHTLFLLDDGRSWARGAGGGSSRRHGGGLAARCAGPAASGVSLLGPCGAPTRQPAGGARHHPAAFRGRSCYVPIPHALGFGAATGRR